MQSCSGGRPKPRSSRNAGVRAARPIASTTRSASREISLLLSRLIIRTPVTRSAVAVGPTTSWASRNLTLPRASTRRRTWNSTKRSACKIYDQRRWVGELLRAVEPIRTDAHIDAGQVPVVEDVGARFREFAEHSGKQLLQHVPAATQHAVQMASLRDPLALVRRIGQRVPFDDGDRLVELRKHPGGKQTSHPGAKDDGVRTAVLPIRWSHHRADCTPSLRKLSSH